MKNFISGRDLLTQMDILPFELFNYVKEGHQPLDQSGRPIPPPDISAKLNQLKEMRRELANISWRDLPPMEEMKTWGNNPPSWVFGAVLERERLAPRRESLLNEIKTKEKELECIENKYSWADYKLPDDEKAAQRIIGLLQDAFFKREQDAEQDENKLEHYAEIGRRGGKAAKVNKAILEAAIQYLRDNYPSKVSSKSNEQIATSFCKKFKEGSVMTIDYDGYRWEVYCYEKRVYSRCDECLGKSKPKNEEKSIAYSTFKKSYIPMARKSLSDNQSALSG